VAAIFYLSGVGGRMATARRYSTSQLLVCVDDIHILEGSVHTIKNAEALVVPSKETGLEVNADKYMVMSRDWNAGRRHNTELDNTSSERVEDLKYLGTTLKNQNSIQKENKSRLKSGNSFCHSVQNLLSSSVLSKILKIKIYRTIIFPVVLYGCETWSLKSREKHRLRVFKNRVLRRIFGPKEDEKTDEWRKLHNEEINDMYSSANIFRVIKSRGMRWAEHVARMGESRAHTGFWWRNLRKRDYLGDPGLDGRIMRSWILRK
jgi:hypothetical protein